MSYSPSSWTQPVMSFNGVPTSAPSSQHYMIASEDVSVDQTNPLGPAQRNGRVLKGYWNDSVVAVKLLKSEIPGEARFFICFLRRCSIETSSQL